MFAFSVGFPGGTSGKEPACQFRRCERCELDPWFGKIPWRKAWQHTPVFSPEIPMDRGAWWITVHSAAESNTTEATRHTPTCAPQVVLVVENASANAGDVTDVGSISGLGRSL